MNPLLILRHVRELSSLIERYNALVGPDRKLSLAFTNRSFILACVAWLAGIALLVGLPLPLPVDVAGETVYAVLIVGGFVWAGLERAFGKTLAVFNRKQVEDRLTDELQKAGLDARVP